MSTSVNLRKSDKPISSLILKMNCESLLEVNQHTIVYQEFYQVMQMMRSTIVPRSRFSHFRIEITYNKEIAVYCHLRIQYFPENIQMIWDNIWDKKVLTDYLCSNIFSYKKENATTTRVSFISWCRACPSILNCVCGKEESNVVSKTIRMSMLSFTILDNT